MKPHFIISVFFLLLICFHFNQTFVFVILHFCSLLITSIYYYNYLFNYLAITAQLVLLINMYCKIEMVKFQSLCTEINTHR